MRAGSGAPARVAQQGFTLVWVLLATALIGVALAAVGTAWSADAQREREAELLEVGEAYARAIAAYRDASPGSIKRYPPSVDALLLDTRFGVPVRHLRRPFADPLRPERAWGELRGTDGSLRGVYSQSTERPLREQPLDLGILWLPAARQYADWHFEPLP